MCKDKQGVRQPTAGAQTQEACSEDTDACRPLLSGKASRHGRLRELKEWTGLQVTPRPSWQGPRGDGELEHGRTSRTRIPPTRGSKGLGVPFLGSNCSVSGRTGTS